MIYTPGDEQRAVIASRAPNLVILGGAGTGKTTTAVIAAHSFLEEQTEQHRTQRRQIMMAGERAHLPVAARALFLSFSRTAVAQVIDRASRVVGRGLQRLEVFTFHGFAWRVISDFGACYGYPPPQSVISASNSAVPGAPQGLTYDDLLPAALELLRLRQVADHYDTRYRLLICDEVQDTNDEEWQFMQSVAPTARRMFLGDKNQCIYSGMKQINPERRIQQAKDLPEAQTIPLPKASHRDPTQQIPAAATAALERDFANPAIQTAAQAGRLRVTRRLTDDSYTEVVDLTIEARERKRTVNIFTHTNQATTELSDALTAAGVLHEQVGFGEAHGEAVAAQLELLRLALGEQHDARRALAVFVKANTRGKKIPNLIYQMLDGTNRLFEQRFAALLDDLVGAARAGDPDALVEVVRGAYRRIGVRRGEETWDQAAAQFNNAVRLVPSVSVGLTAVEQYLTGARDEALVGSTRQSTRSVQVMNLHQTKGREADVTLLLLNADEFYGYESEPFAENSPLVYVVMTRARHEAHVVCARSVHPLWHPLVTAIEAAQS